MAHNKKEDKEFDFKLPINQSDVYHHTPLSHKGETPPDEWYLWERQFPMRLVDSEKGDFNPVPTLLLFFCSQVYNTFLQKPLIDTFKREKNNKETSRLYREVGEVAVHIKTPSQGILNVYREDLNTRVM